MIIKCWGSRGSIPVSGKTYLKYGGDTTCIEIRTQSGDIIIIDAGTGIRRLGNQLLKEKRRPVPLRLYPCPLGSRHGISLLQAALF